MNRVVILGATSPIARGLAMRYARDGARLYLAARDGDEAARIASDVQIRCGAAVESGTFDACEFPDHERFARDVVDKLGGLEGVVLCFGTLGDEETARHQPDAALAILNQNFNGAVSLLT